MPQFWIQDTKTLLWAAGAGLLLLSLIGAFLYVLMHRKGVHRQIGRMDDWLLTHTPRVWRPLRNWLTRRSGLVLLGGAGLFVGTVYLFAEIADSWVDQEVLYHLDQSTQEFLHGATSEALLQFMYVATHLGDAITMLVVAGLVGVLLWKRHAYRMLMVMIFTLGGGQGVVYALKWAFGRARPAGGLTQPLGASFPSGHTFSATILYGFLMVLAWRFVSRKSLRFVLLFVLTFFILITGVSRVLLGVHWVSDVLGGWMVGLAWLTCVLLASQMLKRIPLSWVLRNIPASR